MLVSLFICVYPLADKILQNLLRIFLNEPSHVRIIFNCKMS